MTILCFWLHSVVKPGICYSGVCPSITRDSCLNDSRYHKHVLHHMCLKFLETRLVQIPNLGFTLNECINERPAKI